MPRTLHFSGYYKYMAWTNLKDDGFSTFTLTLESDNTVHGTGSDNIGPFNMSGALLGDNLRFVKQYTTSKNTWKYIGTRVAPKGNVYQFVGTWGYPQETKAVGEWVFSAVDQSSSHQPIEGQWIGNYTSGPQRHPMNLTIGIDSSFTFTPNGPYHIIGNGSDNAGPFEIKGTVQKANPDGSGSRVDFVKSYSKWRSTYEGKYDGKSYLRGIWKDQSGSGAGTFQLTQITKLSAEIATPILQFAAYNLPCPPTLDSAIHTASKNNSGVTPANTLTLVKSFTS